MMMVCDAAFSTFITNTVVPMSVFAGIITSILIGLGYMLGQFFNNPKATTWAKTEVIQLVMSAASVTFIIITMSAFCTLDMESVKSVFGLTPTVTGPCGGTPGVGNLYISSLYYMKSAACFAHSAMSVVRYHLSAYTVLSNLNLFECSLSTGSVGWGCLFGYSGTSMQPLGGYGAVMSALNVFFNSTMVSYMSALNFLFILLFIYKGFVLFFLPIGIFLRSMPYLRTFGGLLISVALTFLVVYPLLLSIFSLMGDVLFQAPIDPASYNEQVFADTSSFSGTLGTDFVKTRYWGWSGDKEKPIEAIELASAALITAVFLPSLALLGAIASIRYTSKILGEEIDLSRIVQMV